MALILVVFAELDAHGPLGSTMITNVALTKDAEG